MERGQISFDLMIAVIAVILFGGVLQLSFSDIETASFKTGVKNQEREIAYNIADAIAAAEILSDADSYYFELETPGLKTGKVSGSEYGEKYCYMTINGSGIEIQDVSGEITSEIEFESSKFEEVKRSEFNCKTRYVFSNSGVAANAIE